jgi:hypothetical protein
VRRSATSNRPKAKHSQDLAALVHPRRLGEAAAA